NLVRPRRPKKRRGGQAFSSLVVTVEDQFNNPVPAGTNVTFTAPSSAGASGVFPAGTVSITGASESGTTVTIAATNSFTAGQQVVIAGVGAGYNGTFTILAANLSSSAFSYTDSTTSLNTLGIGGTATAGSLTITAATNASGQVTEPFTANTHSGSYTVTATASGVGTPATFSLTNNPAVAATITATSGTPQSTAVGTVFSNLVVTVVDGFGNPVSGQTVTFTAPNISGASGTF